MPQREHGAGQIRPPTRMAFLSLRISRAIPLLWPRLCHPSEPGHPRLLRPPQKYYHLPRVVCRPDFFGGFLHRRVHAIPVLYSCIFHPRIVGHLLRRLRFQFPPALPCDKSCSPVRHGSHDYENVGTMCSDLRSVDEGFCNQEHR